MTSQTLQIIDPSKKVKGILLKNFEIDSKNLSPTFSLDMKSLKIPKEIHDMDPGGCSITKSSNSGSS